MPYIIMGLKRNISFKRRKMVASKFRLKTKLKTKKGGE
jgi:hypothetical protein